MKHLLKQVDQELQQEWEKSSFLGKVFFIIGLFFICRWLLSLISPCKND
ncbi:hypothetical protein [Candidatus Proelusimicrobium excrementi]